MSSDNSKLLLDVPLLDRTQHQAASDAPPKEDKMDKLERENAWLRQQLAERAQQQAQTVVLSIPPQHQVMASSAAASASSSAAPLSQFFSAMASPSAASDAKTIIQPITSAADLERLKKLADPEQGNNVEAQAHLGRILLYGGWGVTKDAKEAEKWLRLASKQKASGAQLDAIGNCYEHGWGVTQNANQACACFERAATEYKYAPAQFNFARYQEYGMKDEKAAFQLYSDSADQNYLPAIVIIGQCYAKGYGCLPDHQTALQCYQRAAKQEYPNAYTQLGWAYCDNGIGGSNPKLATTYFRKAAERNDADGQYGYSQCLWRYGTEHDGALVREWAKKAAAQGHKAAANDLTPPCFRCCVVQ